MSTEELPSVRNKILRPQKEMEMQALRALPPHRVEDRKAQWPRRPVGAPRSFRKVLRGP